MSKYKYDKEIQQVVKSGGQCPPSNASECDRTAWRWVFEPCSEYSFLPQAERNPPRLHSAKDLDSKCSCWAISMHASYEKSVKAFTNLERLVKKARKVLGTHVAKGEISQSDGVCTIEDSKGHFDFHPYYGVAIADAFEIEGAIP